MVYAQYLSATTGFFITTHRCMYNTHTTPQDKGAIEVFIFSLTPLGARKCVTLHTQHFKFKVFPFIGLNYVCIARNTELGYYIYIN